MAETTRTAKQTNELTACLADIQKKLIAPKDKRNDFGKYQYRSSEDILAAVKPLLNGHPLTMTGEMVQIGGWIYAKETVTLWSLDGTQSISCTEYAREDDHRAGMSAGQCTGSAVSYARKYALGGLFAIDNEKDPDTMNNTGNVAPLQSKQTKKQSQQPTVPTLDQIIAMVEACKTKEELENIWNSYAPYYGNSEDFQREIAIHPANKA